jgi:hypothetical protein
MANIPFPTAAAVTNAMATLSRDDRMRCLAHPQPDGSYIVEAPDDLVAVLQGDHPPAPLPPVITYKADIWRRATDGEAEQLVAALDALPVRKRKLFEDAQYLSSADSEFDELRTAVVALFGEVRASELLAAS